MSTVKVTNLQNAGSASVNMTLDTAGNATVANTLAMGSSFLRNRIINGDMRIDQRNAGASVTPNAGGIYLIDRWNAGMTIGSKYSVQQNAGGVTPPTGFTNYLGVTSLSAYALTGSDSFSIQQIIEGFNVSDLNWGTASASPATLSFWVRSSLTGTFGGSIATTKTAIWVMPFTYTISSANTWTYISVPVTAPTSTGGTNNDNTAGIFVRFGLGSTGGAAGGTAGTWTNAGNYIQPSSTVSVVSTNAATWYVTGVQLEAGTVATPFERRLYGQELALCQRYFEKSFSSGIAPQNGGSASTYADSNSLFSCVAMNSSYGGGFLPFKITKRTTPTLTLYGDNSGYWSYGTSSAAGTFAANVISPTVGENGVVISQVVVNNAFAWVVGHWTASAEL